MSRSLLAAGLAGALFCGGAPAAAASELAAGSTVITAAQLTYDYKRAIAVFERDVVVVDPQVRIESDHLTVLFDGTNDIKSVTAAGNVRVTSEDRTARCRKAIYIASKAEILLMGDAELTRRRDSLSGEEITFRLNEEKVVVRPGRLVVYPERDAGDGGALEDRLIRRPGSGRQ